MFCIWIFRWRRMNLFFFLSLFSLHITSSLFLLCVCLSEEWKFIFFKEKKTDGQRVDQKHELNPSAHQQQQKRTIHFLDEWRKMSKTKNDIKMRSISISKTSITSFDKFFCNLFYFILFYFVVVVFWFFQFPVFFSTSVIFFRCVCFVSVCKSFQKKSLSSVIIFFKFIF